MRDSDAHETDELVSSDREEGASRAQANVSTATTVDLEEPQDQPMKPSSIDLTIKKRTIGDSSSSSDKQSDNSSSSDSESSSSDEDSDSDTSQEARVRKPRSSLAAERQKLLKNGPGAGRTSVSQIASNAFASPRSKRRSSSKPLGASQQDPANGSAAVDEEEEAERELRRLSQTHVRVADLDEDSFMQEPQDRASTENDDENEALAEERELKLEERQQRKTAATRRRLSRLSSSEPSTDDDESGVPRESLAKPQEQATTSAPEVLPHAVGPDAQPNASTEDAAEQERDQPSLTQEEIIESIRNFLPPRSASAASPVEPSSSKSTPADTTNSVEKRATRSSTKTATPLASESVQGPKSPVRKKSPSKSSGSTKQPAEEPAAPTSNAALSRISEDDSSGSDEETVSPSFAQRDLDGTNDDNDAFKQPSPPQESQFVPLSKDKPLFLDEDPDSQPASPDKPYAAPRSPRAAPKTSTPARHSSRLANGTTEAAPGSPRRSARKEAPVEPSQSSSDDDEEDEAEAPSSQPISTAAAIGRSVRSLANGLFKSSSSNGKTAPPGSSPSLTSGGAGRPPSSSQSNRSTRASGMPSLSQLDALALANPPTSAQRARNISLPKAKPKAESQLSWVRRSNGADDDDDEGQSSSDSD